ncbi:hypothetical protein BKA70DRAFT_12175 [Coprinopsis sp. MPI-PUGE-AT-0042]|nr:hypothetical protein BKA70DRAFT_12175 [Coprinopsis sp. MPI-PUGE-AT-0042]
MPFASSRRFKLAGGSRFVPSGASKSLCTNQPCFAGVIALLVARFFLVSSTVRSRRLTGCSFPFVLVTRRFLVSRDRACALSSSPRTYAPFHLSATQRTNHSSTGLLRPTPFRTAAGAKTLSLSCVDHAHHLGSTHRVWRRRIDGRSILGCCWIIRR